MAHRHPVYDTDPHFSIDPISKAIKNESSRKTVIMQFDHESERFTFEMPKVVEGHDMTLCNLIEVHFTNRDSITKEENRGVYEVQDMQVSPEDEDTIIFSWLIRDTATQLAGPLEFQIDFKCIADDGTRDYSWHTDKYTKFSVSSSINNSDAVINARPDILSQWAVEIDAKVEQAEAAIGKTSYVGENGNWYEWDADTETFVDSGVHATGPIGPQGKKGDVAGAIILGAEGKNITVNDAAEYGVQRLALFGQSKQNTTTGKNVLPYPYESITHTAQGITFTDNGDGSITVSGSSTGGTNFYFATMSLEAGDYVVSGMEEISGILLRVYNLDASQTIGNLYGGSESFSFTLNQDAEIRFYLNCESANMVVSGTCRPMLRLASVTDNTWEPYTGGIPSPNPQYPQAISNKGDSGAIELTAAGKNLASFPKQGGGTYKGIEYTWNDGKISAHGTQIELWGGFSLIEISDKLVDGETYTLSQSIRFDSITSPGAIYAQLSYLIDGVSHNVNCANSPVSITVDKSKMDGIALTVNISGSLEPIAVTDMEIQLEHGSTATEYEPCRATTATLTTALPLCGIPVNSGGNVTIDGQRYIADTLEVFADGSGRVTKRTSQTIMGPEKIQVMRTGTRGYVYDLPNGRIVSGGICSHYTTLDNGGDYLYLNYTNALIFMCKTTYPTLDAFTEFLTEQYEAGTPVTALGRLITPEIIPLTAEEVSAVLAMQTHKEVTHLWNDAQAHMEVECVGDTRKYVDAKDAEIAEDIESINTDLNTINAEIGNIASVLDAINGEVV